MTPGPLAYTRTKCPDPATAYGGPGGEVVLDQAPDGKISLDVRLEKESLWLTQNQVSLLFDTERSVVTKHLKNIFNSGELDKDSVCAFFAHTAEDGKTYKTQYYNLDAILSVGYRVNSGRGTQFRIWATQVLRDHVLKGYTVNLRRLEELKQTLKLASIVADQRALNGGEAAAILHVLRDYAFALSVLDDYDHGRVPRPEAKVQEAEPISPDEARRLVAVLGNVSAAAICSGVRARSTPPQPQCLRMHLRLGRVQNWADSGHGKLPVDGHEVARWRS